ncbi:hypothetical protein Back11_30630 [Paenibacillus baekrokdamisoli]|uniref:PAS domain-containing protein n=2 Tax=Paenibacillus baekrokdamisoli TaxID=1712516 RepID=A0A3G9JCQ4_9BACL|nr:PAS domain S-box protein [Paenibacillus baekrokdamisoli]BBH21718.1 hypothetical protein Back11_30630 [Paenibacillus baekrokdamisoli]
MRYRALYVNESLAKKYMERRKLFKSLRSSMSIGSGSITIVEQLYHLLDKSLTCAYLVQDDKIVYVNQSLANLFGYAQNEMLAMRPLDFVHPEDSDRLRKETEQRLQGHEKREFYSLRGIRKDKSFFYYETKATSFLLNGKPALLGTVIDITNLVQANQIIRENEMRYRQLIRYLPEPIIVHDGNKLLLSIMHAWLYWELRMRSRY